MSYKKLEIWKLAKEVVIEIHDMSLQLPAFEMYEEGKQIRKSSKSVRSNIVEGYGRRIYKADFIRFLIMAQASNDETIDHLETLFETKSLESKELFDSISAKLMELGRKINRFIQAVNKEHNVFHENQMEYLIQGQESSIKYQVSSIKYQESRIKNHLTNELGKTILKYLNYARNF